MVYLADHWPITPTVVKMGAEFFFFPTIRFRGHPMTADSGQRREGPLYDTYNLWDLLPYNVVVVVVTDLDNLKGD